MARDHQQLLYLKKNDRCVDFIRGFTVSVIHASYATASVQIRDNGETLVLSTDVILSHGVIGMG